jgi:hypothetical protein
VLLLPFVFYAYFLALRVVRELKERGRERKIERERERERNYENGGCSLPVYVQLYKSLD